MHPVILSGARIDLRECRLPKERAEMESQPRLMPVGPFLRSLALRDGPVFGQKDIGGLIESLFDVELGGPELTLQRQYQSVAIASASFRLSCLVVFRRCLPFSRVAHHQKLESGRR
jgi:hypothetical protein